MASRRSEARPGLMNQFRLCGGERLPVVLSSTSTRSDMSMDMEVQILRSSKQVDAIRISLPCDVCGQTR